MTNTPYFSIIIPLYNKETYVAKCINSILQQTFTQFEIIIVNDCSTDKSFEIATTILDKKARFINHEKNQGLSATRNTGIKHALANYITYLDADDTWEPQFLETIYRLTQNFPDARIFGTNYYEVYNDAKRNPITGTEHLPQDFEGYLNYFKDNIKQGFYTHGSICFHKDVFDKVGYYNTKHKSAQDLDFNIRANYYFKLAYSNKKMMNYVMDVQNQITRLPIKMATIPDYNQYKNWENENTDIKKHIDFLRYMLVTRLKKNGDTKNWKKIYKNIDQKNLNWKQRFLLQSPNFILILIKSLKEILNKIGIKVATYS